MSCLDFIHNLIFGAFCCPLIFMATVLHFCLVVCCFSLGVRTLQSVGGYSPTLFLCITDAFVCRTLVQRHIMQQKYA